MNKAQPIIVATKVKKMNIQDGPDHASDGWADGPGPSSFGELSKLQGAGVSGQETKRIRDNRGKASSPQSSRIDIEAKRIGGEDEGAAKMDSPDTGWQHPLEILEEAHLRLPNSQREEYVNTQLINKYTADHHGRQLLGIASSAAIALVCWPFVSVSEILVWIGASVVLIFVRIQAARNGWRARAHGEGPTKEQFGGRLMLLAGASGALLGASVLMFFGRVPIGLQFLCWMILAGLVTFPLHSWAMDPLTMRPFIDALFAAVFGSLLIRSLVSSDALADHVFDRHYESWFLALPPILWLLVHRIARLLHSSARESLEASFDKQVLIDALAERRLEAEEAVKVKNRFIATAAHDMRQPVLALSLYADYLNTAPDQQAELLPKIVRAAASVNSLFDSLFDLARMDNQQLSPRFEALWINDILADLRDQFAPLATARGIELRMRACHQQVLSDPVLIRRMIGNVISNALKYTLPGKSVLITARSRAPGVTVEVWDQGIGIASPELHKVFSEFYKVDSASASDGFGLGLSIVARLAHVLNTHISVRSQLGRGTVFRFKIASGVLLARV